jgi:ketosteroid isomerase-like protein
VSERVDLLRAAFAALDRGDTGPFAGLFRPDAQWRGVEGSGFGGTTPL